MSEFDIKKKSNGLKVCLSDESAGDSGGGSDSEIFRNFTPSKSRPQIRFDEDDTVINATPEEDDEEDEEDGEEEEDDNFLENDSNDKQIKKLCTSKANCAVNKWEYIALFGNSMKIINAIVDLHISVLNRSDEDFKIFFKNGDCGRKLSTSNKKFQTLMKCAGLDETKPKSTKFTKSISKTTGSTTFKPSSSNKKHFKC